jgi:single-stranded-DNA-specific exonuclease
MPTTRGHFKRWRWSDDVSDADTEPLERALRCSSLAARLLWRRGIRDAQAARRFFNPTLMDLHDPSLMAGCARAADRLVRAVRAGQKIAIYGDYDVDGVTATAILHHTLKTADPRADLVRYVPHRVDEGYGLNAQAIAELADQGAAVIVSVDCGITAVEPARVAAERGVDLIITDHHQRGPQLPDAYALVHPQLPDEQGRTYPFADICGAGVAYKLAWQIARAWCGSEKVTEPFKRLLVDLLSFAALGTIADVVPLVGENRTIARFGLGRIKQTPFEGLNALIDASRLRDEKIDAYHVGFVLGPRLNACGRMGHAREAVRLLTEAGAQEGLRIAQQLNTANDRRRAAERAIFEQARAMAVEQGMDQPDVRAIVLGHREWHIGVVGIVCSRMVEAFGRPTVLLNTANGSAHGSARSIDGFDIHQAFAACGAHLQTFGGHAMAAGLRLAVDQVEAFRLSMQDYAARHIAPDQLTAALDIDAEADLAGLTPAVVAELQRLAPFGRANPQPLLMARGLRINQKPAVLGAAGKHLSFIVNQGGSSMRCVAWNMAGLADRLPAGAEIDLVVEPAINHWNGRTSVELVVRDFRPHGAVAEPVA